MIHVQIPVSRYKDLRKKTRSDRSLGLQDITFEVGDRSYIVAKGESVIASKVIEAAYERQTKENPLTKYTIETNDPYGLFENIKELFENEDGVDIELNSDNMLFYINIANELDIDCLRKELGDKVNEELNIQNCVLMLIAKRALNKPIFNEISFIARNILSLSQYEITRIDPETLQSILQNDSFDPRDQDQFLKLVIDTFNLNNSYMNMFKYIRYEELSKETLGRFLNCNEFRSLSPNITSEIISRLYNSSATKKKVNEKLKIIDDVEITEAYNTLSDEKNDQKAQEKLVRFCFERNYVDFMKDVLDLPYFNFGYTYDVLLFFLTFF